ncbi:MAG: ABC transporter ATP-binding protein [Erysipelothrix sp.]|nr:ABC transporter ATP-binding protein [Erysipelothrix sp.]
MKLIIQYIKKYKFLLTLNMVALLAFTLVELGIPTIMGTMINEGVETQNFVLLQKQGAMLLMVAVLGGLGTILLNYTSSRIASYMTRDIRKDMFDKTQELSHSEYNEIGVSSLITRVSNDVWQLQLFTQMLLRMGIHSPFMIFFSMVMIFKTSTTLAFVMSASIPFILLVIYITIKKSNPLSKYQQKLMDTLSRLTRENITGVRVIRAFRKDNHEIEKFEKVNKDYSETSIKLFRTMSRAEPLFFFFLELTVIAIMWTSTFMVADGALEVGSIVAFLEYQFQALFSLLLFAVVFIMYPRAAVSASRIQEVLDMESTIVNPINGVSEGDEKPSVVFENVSFAYPDGEANVLEDINFSVQQGETIAFIGSTGSGKSTLINLIVRFYDVTNGRVLVNGVDVREWDLYDLRYKVGFIPQKSLLFSGSIAENIRYGKEMAIDQEVVESAELASARDFIEEKPNQYDEWLSEGGSNVSGGQKQRLSIARALVRKPQVYIFDDSFSALDYKTDASIRSNLKAETKDAIMMVVAQRISSIMDADKIIVLNEGKIVGSGTHSQLMKDCEVYIQIAKSQFSEEEMEKYE